MALKVIRLEPHAPLPDDPGSVLVMRRFAEEEPARTEVEVTRSRAHAHREALFAGGGDELERLVGEAERFARAEGVARVYVIDRAAGAREQAILARHGDHSAHGDPLSDTDEEDGETGPDLRRP